MAKGWTRIETVNDNKSVETDAQKQKNLRNFANAIHQMKSLSPEDLKKRGDENYATRIAEDEKLLDAFDKKKLKSKDAVKRALQLKKEKAKTEKKTQKESKQQFQWGCL